MALIRHCWRSPPSLHHDRVFGKGSGLPCGIEPNITQTYNCYKQHPGHSPYLTNHFVED